MTAMARRKLSTRGRVVAAGVCVGVTGLLAGLMAATDDTGNASAGTTGQSSTSSTLPGGARTGSGYDGNDNAGNGRAGDPGGFQGDGNSSFGSGSGDQSGTSAQPTFPQPHTRSGGS
jgi:hypothetical protein